MSDKRREFEAIAMPLAGSLFALAYRLTGSRDTAQDVVQETFLRAFRTFDNFERGTNARAWLFTVMYSIVRNRRRQSSRRPVSTSMSEMEQNDAALPPVSGWGSHLELMRGLDRQRLGDEIVHAVEAMPDEWRAVFLLVVVEELPYDEVASILGCAPGTVGTRMFRARRHLMQTLSTVAKQEGLSTEEGR